LPESVFSRQRRRARRELRFFSILRLRSPRLCPEIEPLLTAAMEITVRLWRMRDCSENTSVPADLHPHVPLIFAFTCIWVRTRRMRDCGEIFCLRLCRSVFIGVLVGVGLSLKLKSPERTAGFAESLQASWGF